MIEHTGEVHLSNCPSVFGDASPISGASHKCLIPFISVACDTSVYPFGNGLSRCPREPHMMYSSLAASHTRQARGGAQWQGHDL